MTSQEATTAPVRAWAEAADKGYTSCAEYWSTLDADDWHSPTGCDKWDMNALAGHVVGEAVWFANLAAGAVNGEPALPMSIYDELKAIGRQEMTGRTRDEGRRLRTIIDGASPEQLASEVDMGFAKMPLGVATSVAALEGVIHAWDGEAVRNKPATIPTDLALVLVDPFINMASMVGRAEAAASNPGTYALDVSDGVGCVLVTVDNGSISAMRSGETDAGFRAQLSPDQFVRLISGRLYSEEVGSIRVEGDRSKLEALTHIFAGIANE